MGATPKSKRERWNKVASDTGNCPICPPHKGENARKRPRPDRYKSKRKGA
jgi:hypothetical protein